MKRASTLRAEGFDHYLPNQGLGRLAMNRMNALLVKAICLEKETDLAEISGSVAMFWGVYPIAILDCGTGRTMVVNMILLQMNSDR